VHCLTSGGDPIRRYEADLSAFQEAQQALQVGKIVAIAPEGTRSRNGKLQKALPGIVLLAARSGRHPASRLLWARVISKEYQEVEADSHARCSW